MHRTTPIVKLSSMRIVLGNQLENVIMRSTLFVLLLAFSAAASAEGFNYTFVSAGYGTVDFDDVDVDGDGFDIGGSVAVADNIHLFAGYEIANLDFDVDASGFNAGIGYNTPLSNVIDFVAALSYEYVELDVPGFGSVDENGYGLGAGLRFAATEALELNAGLKYVDLGDSDDTGFGVGGLYNFTETFALGLTGNWTDDATSYSIGGRLYFGD